MLSTSLDGLQGWGKDCRNPTRACHAAYSPALGPLASCFVGCVFLSVAWPSGRPGHGVPVGDPAVARSILFRVPRGRGRRGGHQSRLVPVGRRHPAQHQGLAQGRRHALEPADAAEEGRQAKRCPARETAAVGAQPVARGGQGAGGRPRPGGVAAAQQRRIQLLRPRPHRCRLAEPHPRIPHRRRGG